MTRSIAKKAVHAGVGIVLAAAMAVSTAALGDTANTPAAAASEQPYDPASQRTPEPARMMGEWFIVAQSAGWLERQLGRPSVRFARTGSNTYTTTVSHRRPGNDAPCTYTQDAWFDDPGTNRQRRERMLGPFVRRAEIRALDDDYLIVSSVSRKDFWLLSRTTEPSARATAALSRELAAAEVAGDGLDWPYRRN